MNTTFLDIKIDFENKINKEIFTLDDVANFINNNIDYLGKSNEIRRLFKVAIEELKIPKEDAVNFINTNDNLRLALEVVGQFSDDDYEKILNNF